MSKHTSACKNCRVERPTAPTKTRNGFCRPCAKILPGASTKVSPVRLLSPEAAAWLGAMVEGEGTVTLGGQVDGQYMSIGRKTMERLEQATRVYPKHLSVYSSDVEIIATCLRLTGIGNVYYRPPRPDYVSPQGRRAFAKKDGWEWTVKSAVQLQQLLPQIYHYFTSEKRLLAMLAIPIRGHSCHPSHWESGPLPGKTDEEVTRAWEQFHKEDRIDPRAIRRQHRFKPGHEPDFLEEESGWRYVKIELESDADPDQLDLLHGGPPVNIPCQRCSATQLHAVGEMSTWDIMHQEGVDVANEDDIPETRKKELKEEIVVILACPNCQAKYQWLKELLPRD